MRFKKLIASLLIGTCAFACCACGSDDDSQLPEPNAYYESQERVAEIFNAALDKLHTLDSYRMKGSIASVAEIPSSEEITSAVTPVDCVYQDGKFTIDSAEANVDPHETYFDGERYYFISYLFDPPDKYFVTTNDHTDYLATDFLMEIYAEMVYNPSVIAQADGSQFLSFDIPFSVYESPALREILGIVVDDSHNANLLSFSATVDADGSFTQFTVSFVNDTYLGDELIHQEIAVNMELSDFSTAVLTPPSDLDTYEDWSEELPEDETVPIGSLSPEDLG